MTWIYAALGIAVLGVIAGIVTVIVRDVRRGIQAEPKLEEAKRETDAAKEALAVHQRPDASPAVLGRVLRDMDDEAGH